MLRTAADAEPSDRTAVSACCDEPEPTVDGAPPHLAKLPRRGGKALLVGNASSNDRHCGELRCAPRTSTIAAGSCTPGGLPCCSADRAPICPRLRSARRPPPCAAADRRGRAAVRPARPIAGQHRQPSAPAARRHVPRITAVSAADVPATGQGGGVISPAPAEPRLGRARHLPTGCGCPRHAAQTSAILVARGIADARSTATRSSA